MKSILFIGHNAGRSGAPIVLLELMRWLNAEKPDIRMDLLLLNGGELADEYRSLADVRIIAGASRLRRLSRRVRGSRLGIERYPHPHDVIFGNTVLSLPYLAEIGANGTPTVCWVHEMEYAITRFFTRETFLEAAGKVDRFIAVSAAVQQAIRDLGVTGRVDIVPEVARPLPEPAVGSTEVRRELGFPKNAFLVGCGGTVEWRKGTDLFLQLAAMTARADERTCFVWIGSPEENSEESARIEHDLKKLGLGKRVKFTGITPMPETYLSAIDAFALMSREDPFPLICLEAAGFGKPILCFENGGGMPEFVEDDCGFVVPYLDLEAFRDRIIELASDSALKERLGSAAAVKVKKLASPAVVGGRIFELLEDAADKK